MFPLYFVGGLMFMEFIRDLLSLVLFKMWRSMDPNEAEPNTWFVGAVIEGALELSECDAILANVGDKRSLAACGGVCEKLEISMSHTKLKHKARWNTVFLMVFWTFGMFVVSFEEVSHNWRVFTAFCEELLHEICFWEIAGAQTFICTRSLGLVVRENEVP